MIEEDWEDSLESGNQVHGKRKDQEKTKDQEKGKEHEKTKDQPRLRKG